MRRLQTQLIGCLLFAAPLAAFAAGRPGYIPTPDACWVTERVQGDTVHLKRTGVCDGKPGRAFVETERDSLKVFAAGKFWKEVRVEQMGVPDVAAVLGRADRLAGAIEVPKNRHEGEMTVAAGKLDAYYRSPEFQGRVRAETERIRSQVFGESYARFYPDSMAEENRGKLAGSERVYLFVSSSMPLGAVRAYAASMARLHNPKVMMVMRGFVDGMTKLQPTIDFVGSILKEDTACSFIDGECRMRPVNLVVDPLLFRRYGIDRVPTVVYVRGLRSTDGALSEGDVNNTGVTDSYTVSGDASLEYVLGVIGRESGATTLKELVAPNK